MKRVLLKISYDGTNYHGWQIQPNALTIQELLQNAVSKVLGKDTIVTGCSRTDAGVHAKSFCCHLDCEDNIPHSAFLRGVNSCLPDDISIFEVKDVKNDFHARYDAKEKNYIYRFYVGILNPFYDRYALRLDKMPDINLMNKFCQKIVGTHDFIAFSSSGRSVEETVRTVTDCKVYKDGDFICLDISANGFLYNMVRIIAGTALAVGFGVLTPDVSEKIFIYNDRKLCGDTLSPKGLILNNVVY